jgi:hypothetical protein
MKREESKSIQENISRLLELIEGCNRMIENLQDAGNKEGGLAIKQERHLRKKYTDDLNHLLKNYKLKVTELEIV